MLVSVCLGSNDLEGSGRFYDRVLARVGMVRLSTSDNEIGYGLNGDSPSLWILVPYNRQPATNGNGTQVIFKALDSDMVDRLHRVVLELGGEDEGAPGLRDHTPGYYGAYCRDLDHNKLHVFAMLPPA
jgi:hypothetical protein